MAKKNERIYDELLSFLGDPMFQIPVRTFLDENSLNFDIFCQLMIKRNIMIQEQVLVMIIAATGGLPQSLTGAEGQAAMNKQKEAAGKPIDFDKQEEELLQHVLVESKKEAETVDKKSKKAEQELKKSLELSKQEAVLLKGERKKMEDNMMKMSLSSAPPLAPVTSAAPPQAESKPSPIKLADRVQLPPSLTVTTDKPISGSEAAKQWLASAQADAGQSSTHSAIAASLSKLSPDELKKRQEFLREQRDKLLTMKKQAREKQLGETTSQRPQRPQSAHAARSAMAGKADSTKSAEDEKKIAMRKAIAAKLKAEVIGDKY
ncbi:hypothetical protein LSH36_385g01038 [Paralvinella palmiformis]|uniref:Cilia- and flagella-associated protein 36 n=1 Tax=Paralvinella palmiformis TaxID=53620 RepID=A0AAD9JDG9_9ANNE|nr:hypothetical protein LSH36_385g01038 [Paralvinella palmiformis]